MEYKKKILKINSVDKMLGTVVGKSRAQIISQMKELNQSQVDIIEWRIDYFDHVTEMNHLIELSKQVKQLCQNQQLLITFRSLKNGGKTELMSEDAYLNLIKIIIDFHLADIIDIELNHTQDRVQDLISSAEDQGIKVIKSDF